jgi:hypothetical protein
MKTQKTMTKIQHHQQQLQIEHQNSNDNNKRITR